MLRAKCWSQGNPGLSCNPSHWTRTCRLPFYALFFGLFSSETLHYNLGIVKYPVLDCVVNVCVHVWLDDGSSFVDTFLEKVLSVVCLHNPFLLNQICLNQ